MKWSEMQKHEIAKVIFHKTRDYDEVNTKVRWRKREEAKNTILKISYNFACSSSLLRTFVIVVSYSRVFAFLRLRHRFSRFHLRTSAFSSSHFRENKKLRIYIYIMRNYIAFSICCSCVFIVHSCFHYRSFSFSLA